MDENQRGKLNALEITEGPFERPVGLLTRKRAEVSLPARKFVDLLIAPLKTHPTHS